MVLANCKGTVDNVKMVVFCQIKNCVKSLGLHVALHRTSQKFWWQFPQVIRGLLPLRGYDALGLGGEGGRGCGGDGGGVIRHTNTVNNQI